MTLAPGEEVYLLVRQEGPDPARRLELEFLWSGVAPRYVPLDPQDFRLIDEAGTALDVLPTRTAANRIAFDRLVPGEFRLAYSGRLCKLPEQTGLCQGIARTVRVAGTSSLVLDLRDAVGAPLKNVEAWLHYSQDPAARSFWLEGRQQLEDGRSRLDGVFARPLTVAVGTAERGVWTFPIEDLSGGEERVLSAVLLPPAPLCGRVVDTSGRPLADVTLEVSDRSVPGWLASDASFQGQRQRRRLRTDSDGHFQTPSDRRGAFEIRLEVSPFVEVRAAIDNRGSDPPPLELALPALGDVDLQILAPLGEIPRGATLHIGFDGEPLHPEWTLLTRPVLAANDPAGFELLLQELPADRIEFQVRRGETVLASQRIQVVAGERTPCVIELL